ncbi:MULTISPECIES: MaoC family dehydratase [unclassified Kitasatospora]|uniref:MaoC family dehydratase n=1 Tax=unclassified Kitasatospora TaxID=2633591 RepID=UPI00070CBF08|nr:MULTISPECIES: MaoC family dehydratase [unclassified Kitasatospora]KQV04692.1 dehydratase [Kitasatospora sp. Root107]KRB60784.1 dehydratase [Kitasatospora sp. Root187]
MTTYASLADLTAAVGTELGTSEWHTIDQARVDLFAEATGDHQWIHVDPVRAKESAFGGTIAHGYLTLSLIPVLAKECYAVEGIRMALNYGSEKVRFPAPVPVGTAIRATAELISAEQVAGGVQAVVRYTITSEGSPKPHCVAETITRFYPV